MAIRASGRPSLLGPPIKNEPDKGKPASPGKSAQSPGHLKKAAGVQSAKTFAPGYKMKAARGAEPAKPPEVKPVSAGSRRPLRKSPQGRAGQTSIRLMK